MSALEVLWLTSLILAGGALCIMLGLIAARMIDDRRESVREAERRRQVSLLLAAQPSREHFEGVDPAADLLTDLTLEIIQLVRGEERENFIASAGRLGVPERLRERLRRGSVRTRLTAAEALAYFGDPQSVEALEAALDDPSPDVRLAAALSLTAADEAPPAVALVERLGIGTRENSLLTITLFREIARKRPGEIKALVFDPQTIPAVKAAAIEALTASADYSLVSEIADLATRAQAGSEELPRYLHALGEFGHPAAGPAILQCLESAVPRVRAEAAEAAGRIGLAEAAPRLGELLGDEDWWVRFRAGQALVRLGRVGETLLTSIAEAGPEPARRTASLTLAERSGRA